MATRSRTSSTSGSGTSPSPTGDSDGQGKYEKDDRGETGVPAGVAGAGELGSGGRGWVQCVT